MKAVTVNTLVITGFGTNSHMETAHTARLAGSEEVDVVHFSDIVNANVRLSRYHILIFPGGFLDGDDLGAGQAASMRWRHMRTVIGTPLLDELRQFISDGKLILGICNGFQLMVKLGILPALDGKPFERQVTLGHNASARFEDRWVRLKVNPRSPCVFTKGLNYLDIPVRHGEGKVIARHAATLQRLADEHLIDPTGHCLGLMPHPEAFHHATNHPDWTRLHMSTPGTMLFVNAVHHVREHLL